MVHCATEIKANAISRQTIGGVEHIVVSSATLPDNIVMNGILYPASVIEDSYLGFENTFAPIEHPVDESGDFISASTPEAIHNFHAGAFNKNVRRKNGRVYIDKYVNVEEAKKTERGLELLARIDELENKENARPINTSIAALAIVDEVGETLVNGMGQKYSRVVSKMIPDHDAILLNSSPAASPGQGVGMAVNKKGAKIIVNSFQINDQSYGQLREKVTQALKDAGYECDYIPDDGLYENRVIYLYEDKYYEIGFEVLENDSIRIVTVPLEVERTVTYTKVINATGETMNEFIVNALKKAGISVEGKTDEQLFNEYNKLLANQSEAASSAADSESEDGGKSAKALAETVANAVTAALAPVLSRLDSVETAAKAKTEAKVDALAETIVNSGKYPGVDKEAAVKLGLETLQNMAVAITPSVGLNPFVNSGRDDKDDAPAEMVA
jgi:hypothetical protein